jgi:hypothetical protein
MHAAIRNLSTQIGDGVAKHIYCALLESGGKMEAENSAGMILLTLCIPWGFWNARVAANLGRIESM